MDLVGRDLLVATCDAALRRAGEGYGSVLLLTGEAGIGKTTVARAAAHRAGRSGAVVRWGACWEGGGVPLTPWVDALRLPGRDACAAIADRLLDAGDDEPTDDERARLRLFSDVVDALRATSASRPQVVVLDDLHWADAASVLLLRAVAAHVPAMPVVVIGTYRDDEVDGDSPLLAMGGGADRLTLDGLSEAEVGRLLGDVLARSPSDDETRVVHRQTNGNPLFVTHMGRLLAAGGTMGVPSGVRDVLARRLARLPAACDDALGAAAVLGQEFEPRHVAALLGTTIDETLRTLDDAARARLATPLDGRPDRWAFTHALVQATRYDALGSPERAALHRKACDVLEAAGGASATVLAHHATRATFEAAAPRPATRARAAGHEALARLAAEEAGPWFEQAIARAPAGAGDDALRARAWLGLGAARLRLGEDTAAGDAFETCASFARAAGDVDLLARAALGFGAGLGGFEVRMLDRRQAELLEEAAATLDSASELRPWVLARLSVALSFADTDDRRRALADEALALARSQGDDRAVAAALASRCDAIAGPDFTAERLAASDEIVAIGVRLGDRAIELLGRRVRVVALAERCDMDGLVGEIDAFERTATRLADPLYAWYVPLWRGALALADGRLAEADLLVADARAVGVRAGSANARILTEVQLLMIGLATGDLEELQRRQVALSDEFPELLLANGQPMMAYADHLLGRPGAVDRARKVIADIDQLAFDAEWLSATAPLADLIVELDLREFAEDLYSRMAPYAGLGVVEGILAAHRGPTDRYLMLLAAAAGDTPATLSHLDRALDLAPRFGALVVADVQRAGAAALRYLDPAQFADRAAALDHAAQDIYRRLGLVARSTAAPEEADAAALVREGDTWALSWQGTTVRVRHAKGVGDLAVLLGHPDRDVHVRELETGAPPSGAVQDVLDDTAVAQYRRRLAELEDDLDEADRHGDAARGARLAAERDALVEQLTTAFGLGGRARQLGDPDERLRKAVSARVKATIDRVEELHPPLGRHLRNAVRTGYWCSYRPEQRVIWRIER